jgi:oligopeptide/dipeptide ABC transporter ATP-binding protein
MQGTSFLLIGHGVEVLEKIADRVLIMYAGRIIERGTPPDVFHAPAHPYTAALLQSLAPRGAGKRFYSIPGDPPGLGRSPAGCPFEPRCGDRMEACAVTVPPELMVSDGHLAQCFKHGR